MKPLTKKLIQAGLINDNFAKMLERWGSLEPGEVDKVRKFRVNLKDLINGLDELIEPKETIQETKFEVVIKKPPMNMFAPSTGTFSAVEDEMGRYIVGPNVNLIIGDHIWLPNDNGKSPSRVLADITPLYAGDEIVAKQLTLTAQPWD